jgi:hypothetical protein
MRIRSFEDNDEDAVIKLWARCGLLRSWNDPRKDIARKKKVQPELFLVGTLEGVSKVLFGSHLANRRLIKFIIAMRIMASLLSVRCS